jgi:histidinol dehydrogenase
MSYIKTMEDIDGSDLSHYIYLDKDVDTSEPGEIELTYRITSVITGKSDSQVLLITTSERLLNNVVAEIERQLKQLSRRDIAAKTLENSHMVLVKSSEEAIALSNSYAPEHLIIASKDFEELAPKVTNAGSVFLGEYACESAGDYDSGTNHTLPTHGYATAYSGVNLDSYNRKITFQHLTEEGIRSIGKAVEVMATGEQLDAHRNAMTVRLKAIEDHDRTEQKQPR